jgi:hypothetical protein
MFDLQLVDVAKEQQRERLADASKRRQIQHMLEAKTGRSRSYGLIRLAIGNWLITLGQRLLTQAVPQPVEGCLTTSVDCQCC